MLARQPYGYFAGVTEPEAVCAHGGAYAFIAAPLGFGGIEQGGLSLGGHAAPPFVLRSRRPASCVRKDRPMDSEIPDNPIREARCGCGSTNFVESPFFWHLVRYDETTNEMLAKLQVRLLTCRFCLTVLIRAAWVASGDSLEAKLAGDTP